MKTIFTAFTIMLLFLVNGSAFSQNGDGSDISPVEVNPQVEQLLTQQDQAKLNGDLNSILAIQKQINDLTGSVSVSQHNQDGYSVPFNNILSTDNINITTLISSSSVKALATCTEARGSNIGRIWVAVGYSGSGTGGDTIAFFRSDDGGLTFTLALVNIFAANVKLKNDQMDMEIIENTTGDKILWLVRGMTNTSSGNQYAGATIINTTTNSASNPILAWPGQGSSTDYYNPRIATDNEFYASNPYVFITVALDSTFSTSHALKVKYAQCNDPLTAATINYNPNSIVGSNTLGYLPHFTQDIAFFRSTIGTDSLVIVNTNRLDSTKISFRTFRRADALSSTITLNFDLQPSANNQTTFPMLATSGNSNVALVYRTNFQNSGDWDIRSYICKGGISLNTNWILRAIDNASSTTDAPGRASVIGVKLGNGSFRACYGISAATGFLMYANYSEASTNWQSPITVLPTGASVGTVPPVAGFRFVNGDSAFMSYSGFNGLNAFSVAGSSGITIGIDPISSNPVSFELAQNFPNPFNPVTKIEFSIPERGLVRLEVFDAAGRLISLLANETMNAGKYQAEFNGEGLSSGIYFYRITTGSMVDTKKMMLVK